MSDEFYTRPILRVHDVRASIAYYCGQLGFEKVWDFGGDALIIAQVSRSGLDVILDAESVIPRPATPSVLSMTLHEGEKLGALHQELTDRGAKIVSPPFEVVWQKDVYQFDVEDLDGNILVFWGAKPE
jgi:uncharacterized glyoxalase superfamily protein PhnB